jgi:hemolysin activation/secretion protein
MFGWVRALCACRVHVRGFASQVAVFGLLAAGFSPGYAESDRSALERELQSQRRDERRAALALEATAPTKVVAYRGSPVADDLPCRTGLDWVLLSGSQAEKQAFSWLLDDLGDFKAACVGSRSLEALQRTLDSRLVERGLVTSRVTLTLPAGAEGRLEIRLHVGRVQALVLRDSEGSERSLPRGVLPLVAGDALDLRALEHGLENLGLARNWRTRIAIEPGSTPDTSRIVILVQRGSPWGLSVDVDNLAPPDYGRLRWRGNLSLSGVLLGPGVVNVSLQRSDRGAAAVQQTGAFSAAWAFGWHRLSLSANRTQQSRELQGATLLFREETQDDGSSIQLQTVPWRTAAWRAALSTQVASRRAWTRIEDIELLLQRRRVLEAELAAELTWQSPDASFSLTASQRRALKNDPRVPGQPAPETKPRHHDLGAQASWNVLQRLRYTGRAQFGAVRNATTAADLLALGGVGTVRGYQLQEQAVGQQLLWTRHELQGNPTWMQGSNGAVAWQLAADWGRVRSTDAPLLTPDRPHRASLSLGLQAHFAQAPFQVVHAQLLLSWPLTQLPGISRSPLAQVALGFGL